MRIPALIIAAALLAVSCAPTEQADLVITGVTAIDAVSGARENVDVVIRGEQIIAAEHQAGAHYEATTIVDAGGKFLIPGLWDAHVHLTFEEGVDHRVFFPLSLYYGVTALRDIGGHLNKLGQARALAKEPLTPDLFVSGPLLDGVPTVYAGETRSTPDMAQTVATPEDARRIVSALVADGVDFLKAYEMLSAESFTAITDAAAANDLKVSAHVPLSMTAQAAARVGADDFQHLRNLELACAAGSEGLHAERLMLLENNDAQSGQSLRSAIHRSQRPAALAAQDPEACDGLIKTLKAEGVYQTPTMMVLNFTTKPLYAQPDYRALFEALPQNLSQSWRERSMSFLGRAPNEDARAYADWADKMIAALYAAEVPIIAGTDAPIGWQIPGRTLHRELSLLVEAGMAPIDAIGSATLVPAQFFGLEKSRGTIAPGMLADLVLLDADPLDDIDNTRSIIAVIKRGGYLSRDTLKAMVDDIRGQTK